MKKFLTTLVITVFVLVLVLFFGRNVIAKIAIETGVKMVTGFPLHMKSFNLDFQKSFLKIEGLEISNPSKYEYKNFAQIPLIYVDFDFAALKQGKIHIQDIQLELAELTVVKNAKGELNLNDLKAVQKTKEEKAKPAEKKAPTKSAVRIDNLGLRVDRVSYRDYSGGKEPQVKEFRINLKERYEHISSLETVVSLIVVKTLAKTSIASLANFNLNDLSSAVDDAMKLSKVLAAQASQFASAGVDKAAAEIDKLAGTAGKTAGELTNKTAETVSIVTDETKKLAGELKEKLKLPFGKDE